jgi:hypothetical protein
MSLRAVMYMDRVKYSSDGSSSVLNMSHILKGFVTCLSSDILRQVCI